MAAFGDGGLYLEKFIARARHIEVQVSATAATRSTSYERECSLQRRRQKVWEEAPAGLSPPTARGAVRLGRRPGESVAYRGAGTLEYLYDEHRRVLFHRDEHPHPGRASRHRDGHRHRPRARDAPDRRRRALRLSPGRHHGSRPRHRSAASTPRTPRSFLPSPGMVGSLRAPGGAGVVSTRMLYPAMQCRRSTIAARQAHRLGRNRDAAIARMRRALDELESGASKTTAPLHRLSPRPRIRAAAVSHRWLEDWLELRTHSRLT